MLNTNDILNDTYQVLGPIGKGGVGVVYLAYHLRLQKYVVVKQIARNIVGKLSVRTEADILKNLHHPNLPQVYDFVQEGDSVYTVIDYIDGEDLDSYLLRGYVFSEQELVRWLGQLAHALEYLHGQNPPVLHMDVKPGNIMIDRQGNAVLIDFNISLGGNSKRVGGLSAAYASPEQFELARSIAQGAEKTWCLDGRSDIYSLGACFYRMISGVTPSPFCKNQKLTEMQLDYSEALLRVIDRCMCPNPEERYPNAEKLSGAISRLRHQNRRYRSLLLGQCGIILAGAALIGSGFFFLLRSSQKETNERFHKALSAFYASYSTGNAEQAENQGNGLLNDETYRNLLAEDGTDRQRLLRIMGDIAYDREVYEEAQNYYRQGEYAGTSLSERRSCRRGRILSTAQAGNLDEAQRLLSEAVNDGMEEDECLCLEAVLYAKQGQTESCIRTANELLAQSTDANLCVRACLAAANTAEDTETQLYWLNTALGYGKQKTVWRGLVQTYARKAEQNHDDGAAQQALYYAKLLADEPYPTKNDRISYAAVLRLNGKELDAKNVLEQLLASYPQDCTILIQLAFVYDELGNRPEAKTYCDRAWNAWQADASPEKPSEDSEEIQNLLSLREQFQ